MRIVDKISIALLGLVFAVSVFSVGYKFVKEQEYSDNDWIVKSVNYGFAIAVDGSDEVLVRNPIPDLHTGDKIIVKGFSYDELPYIASKVATETAK